ncbi:hypothetical protein BDK61_0804 [Haloarcula quadrata]|uniref:Uncharacterized protein n=1 Tax=Haloarcula quadrata TaxID=182779 RepID=A0A495R3Q4_9EURY|nr:hypothetical protein BDK61_0804 [Haloarcula quadrata]
MTVIEGIEECLPKNVTQWVVRLYLGQLAVLWSAIIADGNVLA